MTSTEASIDLSAEVSSKIAEIRQRGGRPRVYTCGSFDMINHDTVALFKAVKSAVPDCELMVGCYCDEDIAEKKGMTVLYEDERLKGLQFCKYVDLIYFPAPWIHQFDFFEENEIDFVAGEINGWDLDLLRAEEEQMEDYMEFKRMFNSPTPATEEIPNEMVHRLENDLGLRLYSNSKFNEMKNKIFSLPVEETDTLLSTPIFRPRSSFHLREEEEEKKNTLNVPPTKQLNAPSAKSRSSEGDGRGANTSLVTKQSQTDRPKSVARGDGTSRKLDALSIQHRENAKSLLAELRAHDMYLPVKADGRKGTSELIIRILRDRNPFYERSIRQGYSRKELNLSVYDYYRIKVKLWFKELCKKLS